MRLYAILVDSCDYEIPMVIHKISLTPIDEDNCYFLDLKEGNEYSLYDFEEWCPYNAKHFLGEYLYNPDTDTCIDSPVVSGGHIGGVCLKDGRVIDLKDEEYEDYELGWARFQDFRNGLPVGDPYFE